MSFQRGPTEPADYPPPPRAPQRGGGWSPGRFSPAILLVAVIVIAILVGAAVFSRRNAPSPTPTTNAGGQPVAAPASAAASSAGSGAASAPPSAAATARPSVAASASATPAPRAWVVANTDGDGVYLRRTPKLADKDTAYVDGTRLVQIGEDVTADGELWHHVRAPDGKSGYVPARYTADAPR